MLVEVRPCGICIIMTRMSTRPTTLPRARLSENTCATRITQYADFRELYDMKIKGVQHKIKKCTTRKKSG